MEESKIEELVSRMRSHGRSLQDRAFVENDMETGDIRWANEFLLKKTGWTLADLQGLKVPDVLPERYHAEMKERKAGKRSKFFVFPFIGPDSRITWLLANDYEESGGLYWSIGKYLATTDKHGQDFDLMNSVMESSNIAGELFLHHEDHNKWTREEIARLEAVDNSLRRELGTVSYKAAKAEVLAKEAVNHALRTNETLRAFEDRIDVFEKHIDSSMTKMEGLEERVTDGIVRLMKTDEFNSRQARAITGLTRNIIVSVAAIVAAGVIAQVLSAHWAGVLSLFR